MISSSSNKILKTSYQFASSGIEGWNDCPVMPSDSIRRSGTTRRPRRRYHGQQETQTQANGNGNGNEIESSAGYKKGHSSSGSIGSLKELVALKDETVTAQLLPIPPIAESSNAPSINVSLKRRPTISRDCLQNIVDSSNTSRDIAIATDLDIEQELNSLLSRPTKLSEKEFQYHSAKVNLSSLSASQENREFLSEILSDLKNGTSISTVDGKIFNFMKISTGVSWCMSLKKIINNLE